MRGMNDALKHGCEGTGEEGGEGERSESDGRRMEEREEKRKGGH